MAQKYIKMLKIISIQGNVIKITMKYNFIPIKIQESDVALGYHNKISGTARLKRHLFLTAMEGRSPRSKNWQTGCLERASFLFSAFLIHLTVA
jgi:hypothetical protein